MNISSGHQFTAAFGNAGSALASDVTVCRRLAADTFGCRAPANDSLLSLRRHSISRVDTLKVCTSTPKVRRHVHELTRAEAAALADAGVMPLGQYLDLAEQNGWGGMPACPEQASDPVAASDSRGFAPTRPFENGPPRVSQLTKQTLSNRARERRTMRAIRLESVDLPTINLISAYAAVAAAFLFVLTVVALAQTPRPGVSAIAPNADIARSGASAVRPGV